MLKKLFVIAMLMIGTTVFANRTVPSTNNSLSALETAASLVQAEFDAKINLIAYKILAIAGGEAYQGCSGPNGTGGFITVTYGGGSGYVVVYDSYGTIMDAWHTSEYVARAMCNQMNQ